MTNLLVILMLLTAVFGALYIIPSMMTRRAVAKVIETFCRLNALDAEHAKTLDELGLAPRTFFDRIGRTRDYKPRALNFLKDANVLRVTPEGRLYLPRRELGQEMGCKRRLRDQIRAALKRYTGNDDNRHDVA